MRVHSSLIPLQRFEITLNDQDQVSCGSWREI